MPKRTTQAEGAARSATNAAKSTATSQDAKPKIASEVKPAKRARRAKGLPEPPRKRPGVKKRATLAARARKATAKAQQVAAEQTASPGVSPETPARAAGESGGAAGMLEQERRGLVSDAQMVERAIRRRWGTRPDVMEALLAKAGRLALSTASERNFAGLFRIYLQAESQNQQDELKGQPDRVQVETIEVMTPEAQRAAILAAISAERARRQYGHVSEDEGTGP